MRTTRSALCAAALEMHVCATELSERWRDQLGTALALHIGINTGRVVAGRLGTAADAAYAVTGDAVNTAARLQSAAAAGQTLVSSATHQLTELEFAFEAAGMLALKGKAEPLQVYRLLDVRDARPTDLRGLARTGSRRGSSAATSSWRRCSLPRCAPRMAGRRS
jgi:adenylate cyclase